MISAMTDSEWDSEYSKWELWFIINIKEKIRTSRIHKNLKKTTLESFVRGSIRKKASRSRMIYKRKPPYRIG